MVVVVIIIMMVPFGRWWVTMGRLRSRLRCSNSRLVTIVFKVLRMNLREYLYIVNVLVRDP